MNVYDFDGTIYNGDSTVDFFFYALKKKPGLLRFFPRQAVGFALYACKRITKTQMKERFFRFLAGMDAAACVESFWDANQEKIFDWYPLQQKKDDIVISASPEFLLTPICKRLGIAHLIASRVDVHSGKFTGENCHGQEKVTRLYAEYPAAQIDSFYSDSLSDLPLAKLAKEAFLVKDGKVTEWSNRTT